MTALVTGGCGFVGGAIIRRLIAEGLSAKEVAGELHISTKTVEAHRAQLSAYVAWCEADPG